ncbi:MAG: RNA-binding transcriptional accessory protein, partial [Firmicutes bacterium]|nr:RNA-binding transcriptional accessory protein [Bacillota bacterium]
ILALNRGEREGVLKVQVEMEPERAWAIMDGAVLRRSNPETVEFLKTVVRDAYKRLLEPALHRELRGALTERAQEGAIGIFALNLKALLMQPPVKGQITMALDPGYRNGCKVAVVDGTGKVLDTAVVYPTFGEKQKQEAVSRLAKLVKAHEVSHIAIGNGTASRETEQTVVELIRGLENPPSYMVVSEAGASVYSASKLGAEEFPDMDVNLRSAVSIARRLQDPLAELVKIEPKAIGVGQYQHDMPPAQLDAALYRVVEDCVNNVGVDLNTASPALLGYVAGLNGTTAQNIVRFREENGAFQNRRQLLKVPKIGPKAFEQCAGFLRVPESKTVLDHTGVHPEAYTAIETMLTLCGYTMKDISASTLTELPQRLKALGEETVAARCGLGLPTLRDAVAELQKPGRDPRDELPPPQFRTDILSIEDLREGMELSGTVRNVIDFGAFVDVGVHQDGLVHISQISNRRITHPSEVLSVGQVVPVMVLEVDVAKKRISLSIKQAGQGVNS